MYPVDTFSTIRRRAAERSPGPVNLFYEELLKPYTLLLVIAGYVTLVWASIFPRHAATAIEEINDSSLIVLLLVVSFVAGIRLIQSFYLANRDYPNLESSFWDIIIFGTVLLFTSGVFITILESNVVAILYIYSGFCFIGVMNFYFLLAHRLPEKSEYYDFAIEKIIQFINIMCFFVMCVLFVCAAITIHQYDKVSVLTIICVTLNIPVILFNIMHSHQLSNFSKFLFDNKATHPNQIMDHVRGLFPYEVEYKPVRMAIKAAHADYQSGYKPIIIERARHEDIDYILEYLFKEFGYMFEILLPNMDPQTRQEIVRKFMSSGFGLGRFGYLRFYRIVSAGDFVGFAKIDTSRELPLYVYIGNLTACLFMIRKVGVRATFQFLSRLRSVYREQSWPSGMEIRLTYIVIFEHFRGAGYGKAFLKLLADALIRSTTNGMSGTKITLIVRSNNDAAVSLFEKIGFSEVEVRNSLPPPPETALSELAQPIPMELRRQVN